MKITEIEIFPVTIPFSGGFASSLGTATGTWEICRFVVVKVHTDEGITGYGEVPPWLRVGKESQNSIIPIIQNYLASELIGEDPFNIAKIWVKMDAAAPENTMAKTPLDLAFYDIMGKTLGVPIYKLLGGRVRDKIPLTGLVGFGELDEMMTFTEMWVKKGYQTVRLKIGMGVNYPALTVGVSCEGCCPTIVGSLIRPGRFTRPLLPILADSEATLRI
ncbi:MAG: mandelate racemase/muconate lactonizing enzyme family protein [Candidatus Heimdallarchaeota archaeon]